MRLGDSDNTIDVMTLKGKQSYAADVAVRKRTVLGRKRSAVVGAATGGLRVIGVAP